MILRRMLVALLCVLVWVVEGTADAEGAAVPMGVVLTSGELDQVTVGMVVEVVYGKGSRHRFSGEWEKLVTVRGVIEVVNWKRRQLVVAREGDGKAVTVPVDRIQTMTVIDTPVESLMVRERPRPFDIENRDLRILVKLASGTASGVVLGAISYVGLGGEVVGTTFGLLIGSRFGFSWGVSVVDPYDSLAETLSAGVLPVFVGYFLSYLHTYGEISDLLYVATPISSLVASELSRKPPQDGQNSHISIRLVEVPNGGLSTVVSLRF